MNNEFVKKMKDHRGAVEGSQSETRIQAFMAYKTLCDEVVAFALKNGMNESDMAEQLTDSDTETVEFFQTSLGYFIPHRHLFSTWADTYPFDVSTVRDAMNSLDAQLAPSSRNDYMWLLRPLENLSQIAELSQQQTRILSGDFFVAILRTEPQD